MILTTKRGMSVETTMSHEEALKALASVPGDFAADLYAKAYSRPDDRNPGFFLPALSADQLAWVHRLVIDHRAKQADRKPQGTAKPSRNLSGIIALFRHAAEHKAYPKIRLTLPNGETLKLQLCGPKSKHAGSVNVTDNGSYPNNKFFGQIDPDGNYSFDAPADVLAILDAFNSDPAEVARVQGQADVTCIFCCKDLDTIESRAKGYGPVCAGNWGLPWDGANNRTAPKRKARKPTGMAAQESRNARAIVERQAARYAPTQPGDEMTQLYENGDLADNPQLHNFDPEAEYGSVNRSRALDMDQSYRDLEMQDYFGRD